MSVLDRHFDRIGDITGAANGGLPKTLKDFILLSLKGLRTLDAAGQLRSSIQVEDYLDTLEDLITVKVHSK